MASASLFFIRRWIESLLTHPLSPRTGTSRRPLLPPVITFVAPCHPTVSTEAPNMKPFLVRNSRGSKKSTALNAGSFWPSGALKSDFGTNKGDYPVVEALATLACDGRRRELAERELVDALRILEKREVQMDEMLGSWAGAMGHTQFMPSSFLAFAVDHDGDGRRDIWKPSNPLDALASTANYLAQSGWQHGTPWGIEVRLP